MNNYERIKSLDIGGMICFIRNLTNDEYTCSYCNDEVLKRNIEYFKQWLESEVME